MNAQRETIDLDVREDIRAGREPFTRILAAAAALNVDQELRLLAPFEPKPMINVLAAQGLSHESKELTGGDWEVRFRRTGQGGGAVVPSQPPCQAGIVEVDARDLEPPQPMVVILEALATLLKGAELHARTVRRPLHLYPQIEARGFRAESAEQPDGTFLTIIRHA